ncbi:MAG: TonB C-terminal domain-containing protein [Gemmatimonadaceae bacterium]|nr:TonB C-terminal domain-containing protein [Gemmatimonadaceae bacterium]
MSSQMQTRSGLWIPLGWSALLHGSVVALVMMVSRNATQVAMPPVYRVNIIAAPAGPRAIGTVGAEPTASKSPPVTTPVAEPVIRKAPIDRPAAKAPKAASTPVESPDLAVQKAEGPRAGGGPIGDRGTDVATVRTEGIDFPFPGYLNNIVRQIALNFNPRDRNAALRSEVLFIVRRDGSVANVRILKKSGSYAFDLEAQGAIEAVSASRGFGPLPEGFRDDALTVYFSFDPKVIR